MPPAGPLATVGDEYAKSQQRLLSHFQIEWQGTGRITRPLAVRGMGIACAVILTTSKIAMRLAFSDPSLAKALNFGTKPANYGAFRRP